MVFGTGVERPDVSPVSAAASPRPVGRSPCSVTYHRWRGGEGQAVNNQQLVEHVCGWNSGICGPRAGTVIFCLASHYPSLCLSFPICKMGVKMLTYLTGLM